MASPRRPKPCSRGRCGRGGREIRRRPAGRPPGTGVAEHNVLRQARGIEAHGQSARALSPGPSPGRRGVIGRGSRRVERLPGHASGVVALVDGLLGTAAAVGGQVRLAEHPAKRGRQGRRAVAARRAGRRRCPRPFPQMPRGPAARPAPRWPRPPGPAAPCSRGYMLGTVITSSDWRKAIFAGRSSSPRYSKRSASPQSASLASRPARYGRSAGSR